MAEITVETSTATGATLRVTIPSGGGQFRVEIPELGFEGRGDPPWAPSERAMPKAFRIWGATHILPVYGKTRDGRRLTHIPLCEDAAANILGALREARRDG